MKYCETCGFDPRFRKANAAATEAKLLKLEQKYQTKIDKCREANANLRRRNDSQRHMIRTLRETHAD